MFVNNYEHSIDDKGRVVLPAAFRAELADGCYVTQQPGGCLAVFPEAAFIAAADAARERQQRGEIPDPQLRTFFGNANQVQPDKQGRVPITNAQKLFAGLDRNVHVVGQWDHVEIWDSTKWIALAAVGEQQLAGSTL
jgi:MraZ protein